MSPIIDWEELRKLAMPPEAARMMSGKGGNMFDTDHSANMYNQMIHMEMGYTLNQINCFDTDEKDPQNQYARLFSNEVVQIIEKLNRNV